MRVLQASTRATLILALTAALGCGRRSIDQYLASGDTFFKNRQFREASIEYRNALKKDAGRGDVHLRLADALIQIREVQTAAEEYVRAAQFLPEDVGAQLKAGHMLLAGKLYKEAQ